MAMTIHPDHTATRTPAPAEATPEATGRGADKPATGTPATPRRRDADGMAVAAFVLGLIGLLLFNVVFGPSAIVLALAALVRGTQRRGRALLGLALGVADLVVLVTLVTADNSVFWNFG